MKEWEEEEIKKFLATMRDLLIRKGHDYSGDEETIKNFTVLEDIGIDRVESVFVRLTDKYMRLKNFMKSGELKVKDETIYDTLVDLANYSVLMWLCLKSKKMKT